MNILINTPLLSSSRNTKESFDNKILILFLSVVFLILIMGLVIIDINKNFSPALKINQDSAPTTRDLDYV